MTQGITRTARFLNDTECKRIHEASLEVLANTGMLVRSARAQEVCKAQGCNVDSSTGRVYFPREVIERCQASFNPTYTFTARDPAHDITLTATTPRFVTASSATRVIDRTTGKQRPATAADITDIARLINVLPGFDIFSISTLADDAPAGQFSLSRFYPALKYCNKPIRSNTMDAADLLTVLDLGYELAGGREAYLEHPFLNHHYCPVVAPLTFDVNSTEACTYLLEQGLPVYSTFCPNGGMTSPLTLVGTLVVGNAEFLACNAYFQMLRENTPTLYAYLPTVADLRTGNYTPGSVECTMLEMGLTEMAQFYGVPSGGYIGQTDSHTVDTQAGQEVALGATAAVLAGASLINVGGLLDSLVTFDFAKAVLDNEVCMNLKRLARGLKFDEGELARGLEEIQSVGPGGVFMMEDLTLENMANICYYSDLACKDTRTAWEEAGSLTAEQRARAKAERLLAEPPVSYIPPEVDALLHEHFPGLVQL